MQASKNLDVVLNGLRENSSEGVDYFQVLVDVFSNELNPSSNAHLQVSDTGAHSFIRAVPK